MVERTAIEAEKRIAEQLESGERILWTGAPRQGLLFRPSDYFQIPFSLMWAGFAIFWEANALRMRGPIFFPVFGLGFVLLGLYFVFGRFLVDIQVRSRTAYGLTNRRALIVSGRTSRSILSLPLKTLSELQLDVRDDGSGTISFGAIRPSERWATMPSMPGTRRAPVPRFELIPSAKEVFGRIREAQGNQS